MILRPRPIAVLVLLTVVGTIAKAQFSTTPPRLTQETQARGYWTDPSTGLMWTATDNGKWMGWHKATKYCRNLRLAGYSDWRLPTIDQLESLVNLKAYTPERVGYSDILHWNSNLLVNGGLRLTDDRQWSSTSVIDVDGHPSKASFWYFDYREGLRKKGFEDWAEGDSAQALCMRDAKVAPSTSSNSAQDIAQPPTENQAPEQKAQPLTSWTDHSAALTWTAMDNGKDVNLGEALQYCRDLRLEQHSDWRLAKIEELEGLRSNAAVPETDGKQENQAASYGLPGELSLTGDQWSSSPVWEDRQSFPGFAWYLSMNSKTRVFDEPSYRRVRRALCVRNSPPQTVPHSDASTANVGSSSEDQTSIQKTQQRGYWVDPSTKLMWTGRDNWEI